MQQVYKFIIEKGICENYDKILHGCRVQKDLYNQALYMWKQYREAGKSFYYNDMDKQMKEIENLEHEINYRLGKTQVAQQTLRRLDKNIKSFFSSIAKWKTNPEKFNGRPKFPKFLRKNGYAQMIYTNQCCSIKNDGNIHLDRKTKVEIPQFEEYKDLIMKFDQVRFNPESHGHHITVEIVYSLDDETFRNTELDYSRYASGDIGLVNLLVIVTDFCQPIIISGKEVKSANNYFNKMISEAQSVLMKMNDHYSSNKIRNLYTQRNNYYDDVFHKVTTALVKFLVENRVGNFVVGYN